MIVKSWEPSGFYKPSQKTENMDKKIIIVGAGMVGKTTLPTRENSPEIIVVDGSINDLIEHKAEEVRQHVNILKESLSPIMYDSPRDGKANRRERRKKQRKNKK